MVLGLLVNIFYNPFTSLFDFCAYNPSVSLRKCITATPLFFFIDIRPGNNIGANINFRHSSCQIAWLRSVFYLYIFVSKWRLLESRV